MTAAPILSDEEVFDETFIPEKILDREGQMKEIARCLSPARYGKSIRNLFVYGPPGVGKTAVCRSMLHDFKDAVYVNCWSKRTAHKVWVEIFSQLDVFGWNDRESTSELVKRLEKSGRKVIVCLDEADHLRDTEILYVLAREGCGLVLISNAPTLLSKSDDRVRSSLLLTEVEFKPYTKDQVLGILKERAMHGMRPEAIGDDLLETIAGMSGGDARMGLQIMRCAAKDAESKGLDTITIEEVERSAKSARKYRLSYLLGKLNEHQQAVYDILKTRGPMKSGTLYAEYCRAVNEPVVDRAYRKHMERMEELGLVKSSGSGRWKRYEIIS